MYIILTVLDHAIGNYQVPQWRREKFTCTKKWIDEEPGNGRATYASFRMNWISSLSVSLSNILFVILFRCYQVSNWFINARVRLWKPMIEEMYLELGKRNGGEDGAEEECRSHETTKVRESSWAWSIFCWPCRTNPVVLSVAFSWIRVLHYYLYW